MLRIIVLIVGLALLWGIYSYAENEKAPAIEADIQARTSAAETAAGFADVVVSTDGRDVTLTGSVAEASMAERAETIAEEVRGVRVVANNIQILPPFSTSICKEADRLALTGSVPTVAARQRLVAQSSDYFPNRTVAEQLSVRSNAPERVDELLPVALRELAQMDEGCVVLDGTDVLFRGQVRSEDAADRIRSEVSDADLPGFSFRFELDVPTLSEEAARCQEEYDRRLAPGENVLFDFDSAELHEEGKTLLDEILEIGALCPDVGVLVTGHTDSVGDKQYNIELSEERAQVVVDYLIEQGADPERLTPVGYGFAQPIAENSTEEGRARNRRIEFRVREG